MHIKIILYEIYYRLFRVSPIKKYKRRGLVVGKNFNMQKEVIIDSSHTWHIEIGDDVTLAPRVHILAHDASTQQYLDYVRIGKVKIGNRVFVGTGTIILPGVSIGDDVIIGAGSVVTHDIPSGQIAVGNPAKVVSTMDAYVAKRREEMSCSPCFGEEYTIRQNVSDEMKKEMNVKMKDRIGYII